VAKVQSIGSWPAGLLEEPQGAGRRRYQGKLLGAAESVPMQSSSHVEVTRAQRRAEVGTRLMINRKYFDDYRFTEEEPPTRPRVTVIECSRAVARMPR
jgi:hypothetical protein